MSLLFDLMHVLIIEDLNLIKSQTLQINDDGILSWNQRLDMANQSDSHLRSALYGEASKESPAYWIPRCFRY